jgi:PleD family two-component response regulator
MALVLCTGIDATLLATRRMILEAAGQKVVTVTNETALLAACEEHSFDVAVLGQAVSAKVKRHICALIRGHCPDVKVLEIYESHTGELVEDADDWLMSPLDFPKDLADRVEELARRGRKDKRSGTSA